MATVTMSDLINNPGGVTYPTRSLDFLAKLAKSTPVSEVRQPTTTLVNQLNVLVVGAGIGGLATAVALALKGHKVTVYEQAPEIAEVGAGIQIPPNSARLLHRWGLEPYLRPHANNPDHISFRRWKDGSVIGLTKLRPDLEADFGAPYYVIHRAHFHDALHRRAVELGVEIKLNSRIESYDPQTPAIVVSGRAISGDLVVAADGVKSAARQAILGGADRPPRKTGFAAYRATVPVDGIRNDPELSWLLESPGLNVWIGDMRHVMTYSIAGGKSFNMVLSHPDSSDSAPLNQKDTVVEMRRHFAGWDTSLVKLIDMISQTLKWPLFSGAILPSWMSSSRKMIMLGDAAHAMLPYMSQGAAMAVEDAAALAEAISHVSDGADFADALELWESERLERTSQMQTASLINGKLWHFADGPEQEARDSAMRPEVEGRHYVSSPNQWSDPVTQKWCYGYDAEKAIRDGLLRDKKINGH